MGSAGSCSCVAEIATAVASNMLPGTRLDDVAACRASTTESALFSVDGVCASSLLLPPTMLLITELSAPTGLVVCPISSLSAGSGSSGVEMGGSTTLDEEEVELLFWYGTNADDSVTFVRVISLEPFTSGFLFSGKKIRLRFTY